MPVYEYEPTEHDCLICEGRFECIQTLSEPAFEYCPYCGMPCKRVVSRATFKLDTDTSPDKAARKGLTTFRRVEEGKWEKVAGPGVDMIVGTDEDMAVEQADRNPKKILDLRENPKD